MNRPHPTLTTAGGLALIALLSCAPFALADEQTEFFEKKIRPVLVEHCLKCHGEKKSENGLRVDSLEALTKGGEIGPSIVPGEPEKSLLILALKYEKEDLEMPPKGKLDDAIIADMEKWVKDGAHWPASAKPKATGNTNDLPLAEPETFLGNDSPAAFERVIDRLLASSGYRGRSSRRGFEMAR